MPAFGKNGIVNIDSAATKTNWNVVKDGKVIGTFITEADAKAYLGHLIVSGANQSEIKIEKVSLRCL